MTRTYTAKIEIRRWKAHTCVGCGGQYAYWMVRKLAYGGSTPEQATEKAHAAADRAMLRDVDRQPCPACGLYQPDMIAGRRRSLHRWMLLAALLAAGLIAGLYLGDVLQADRALLAAMAQVAAIGLLGFLVDLRNPNRDREANSRMAEQAIAAQRVRVLRAGVSQGPLCEPSAMHVRTHHAPPWCRLGRLAFIAAVAALLALALPELARQQSDWPLNANWYPPVVGPGDETCVYLPDSISSIKGYWAGQSTVTAQVDGAQQAAEFSVESSTRQLDWGHSIDNVKPSERSTRDRLWVRVKAPSGENYAGKTLLCKIALTVWYPVLRNDDSFETAVQGYRHEATLKLAAPLAARAYQRWWWGGFAGGEFLLLVSVLARLMGAEALRRTANPAEILDMQPAE